MSRQSQAASASPTQDHEPAPGIAEAAQLHQAGNLQAAADICQTILQTNPEDFNALHLLGVISHQSNQPETAVRFLEKAVAVNPANPQAHSNLGAALKALGRPEEAVNSYRRAIRLQPDYADAYNNLGNVLNGLGQLDEAVACLERALSLKPEFAEAHNNLGTIWNKRGALDKAIACFRHALDIAPSYAEAHNNMGVALQKLKRSDDAMASFQRALEIWPSYAEAHANIGNLLKDNGYLQEAEASYQRAIHCEKGFSEVYSNLASLYLSRGDFEKAIATQRKAMALNAEFVEGHSNLLFALVYGAEVSGEEILAESRAWDEMHAAPLAAHVQPHLNDPDPGRPLRIGYVSPDFREHSVAYFLEPLLANHGSSAVEVFCYSEVAQPDQRTERFQALADHWRPTVGLSDHGLAQLIREDNIDILVDLAGHTANNRLLAFAEKPAPVQASWLGYGATTGMSAIDYRITDAVADPEGAEAQYIETLLHLPGAFFCYAPPADAPEVAPPPVLAQGNVTFGSFNYLAKITPRAIETWTRFLQAIPHSRLLVKSKSLADTQSRNRYLELFAEHGIGAERLDLVPWIPGRAGHLGTYGQIDIALDPFPYNGGTTTCEALWMGVPVITLRGDRFISRMGASILTQLGLTDLIAQSEADYVAKAVALASDRKRLTELRSELRPTMAASPLCDAPTFARNMEAAFRNMWQEWCARRQVSNRPEAAQR
jgi:predicted O-linked N-acetylglucosamine transferase (SPINDLY family)